jgi:hypothetical protein
MNRRTGNQQAALNPRVMLMMMMIVLLEATTILDCIDWAVDPTPPTYLTAPSYVTSSAQPTLTQMKKSYSSSDSSSSSRSLYRQPIYHPEPRSNHHHHQSTVAHTAHLTLLDFIDTTAANPIMCTHTLLDTVAMVDPSIT